MTYRLSQVDLADGSRVVTARRGEDAARILSGTTTLRDLALDAINAGRSLPDLITERMTSDTVSLEDALAQGRIRVPIDHPDPAHVLVAGSGLSHRSWYEAQPDHGPDPEKWPDYYKILRLGDEGGRPAEGEIGAQPEWFYKGNGSILVRPGGAVEHPFYGVGPGEEAEIAGLYVVGADLKPYRIGFSLGNEFSDEEMYFRNVYHLAQSKRRQVSLGPEVLIGAPPSDLRAHIALRRGEDVIWDAHFGTGEDNMLHSFANIEAHTFKYRDGLSEGDVFVLYFGNAVMSTEEGQKIEDGDVFELRAEPFGLALINSVRFGAPFDVGPAKDLW
ncbi:AraD1 family protein [Dinoroseobacter sp. S375]|uniref:AraD1 family protein n=1 Tax=Dinoroseobacter sp. S375 TaxID=3415136 RepID=UPI003C7D09CE